ncbi:t-SNARE [Komagataella phaffii CBS 7435]|uniref:t-SNARE coiled-coil homology domain-containing protein n=2 Tax=Komagataella phaffii TaxID=460519 RepID=C4R5Z2_KOMPG|nr:uncharacterized protein PAS_chr3_1238 [Komagataella phaffii GS115]AOA64120.1 GQ67_04042T0 [Komagataella phaffii]CAH2449207.1 t-SNARE [Komagataella phaffii CBS 7435]AOA68794.1 GQ68_04015T0 [Komagataella phaffii GS115]CAY70978.1 hypothetical protein PAS_chr3_1238 [Komagataella phaffii GS115]CCA39225.1 t-SNARE [Komagataella phaffii CBS 7435]
MFRDRTNLYISYRRTYPHNTGQFNGNSQLDTTNPNNRFDLLGEEEEAHGLIDSSYHDEAAENGDAIEMKPLPPKFADISSEIEFLLAEIEKEVTRLNYLYKKNLLPGFNDTTEDDEKIDQMNFVITSSFQKVYNKIKNIDSIKLQYQDVLRPEDNLICDNLKKNLAAKTQDLSKKFRKLQNNYIKYLKQDDFQAPQKQNVMDEWDDSDAVNIESYSKQAMQQSSALLQEQEQTEGINDQLIQRREKEIYKIAQGVVEISTIFKELETMVIDQGTILDRIDYNLENVVVDLKQSNKELLKGQKHQKRSTKCKLILLLTLVTLTLAVIVLMKPRRTDHYYHDTPEPSKDTTPAEEPAPVEVDEPTTKN